MIKLRKHTKQKIYIALGVITVIALLMLLAFSGGNLSLVKNLFVHDMSNDELREQLSEFGWRGYITAAVLSMLQVVCTFLPAEPAQVLAGFTFGFPVGLLCCMVGVLIGNTLIYMLHSIFGNRLRGFFVQKLHLDLEKIARSSKSVIIILILYILPAIPYGMICFFAASLGMSYRRFIVVTGIGSLPSLCMGVGLGYVTIAFDWVTTLCAFGVLLIVLLLMLLKREALFSKLNEYADKNRITTYKKVKKANGFVLGLVYFGIRVHYFFRGIRVKTVKKVKTPQGPAIILCNHGSFVDFVYATALVRKCKPNFIVARLYFYNKHLNWLLRTLGAFPKSMFATDLENARNCLTVLREGGCLAMMPEARLSTTGRFEDIQSNTYSFIKKSGVDVYTVKLSGDYFADPKWGKGLRRGAVVEAELDMLYTAQQVKELSLEQLSQGIEQRLTYNEFDWLEQRPGIRYRSSRMAEGLENILAVCPKCRGRHTLTTRKNKISCQQCGELTSLDDRYQFTGDFLFRNLAQWYDWQKDLLQKEISENADYCLASEVELRLPGTGKGLTRHGGSGQCRLTREGLVYTGTRDGQDVQLQFPLKKIYRLLFGAGENFEIYDGPEILYFVPTERRSAVDWYMASMILHDEAVREAAEK